MTKFRAGELVAMVLLQLIHVARTAERFLSCDVTSLEPCADSEQVCNATSRECECAVGLVLAEGRCTAPRGGGAGWAAAAAGCAAAALLAAALALLVRRYGLPAWARQALARRRPHNAYEDVMIGADDPPLSL